MPQRTARPPGGDHGPLVRALLAALGYLSWRRARHTVDPTAPGARILPHLSFGTVLFAAAVPLAAGLYLLTTTAWTLAETPTWPDVQPRRARPLSPGPAQQFADRCCARPGRRRSTHRLPRKHASAGRWQDRGTRATRATEIAGRQPPPEGDSPSSSSSSRLTTPPLHQPAEQPRQELSRNS